MRSFPPRFIILIAFGLVFSSLGCQSAEKECKCDCGQAAEGASATASNTQNTATRSSTSSTGSGQIEHEVTVSKDGSRTIRYGDGQSVVVKQGGALELHDVSGKTTVIDSKGEVVQATSDVKVNRVDGSAMVYKSTEKKSVSYDSYVKSVGGHVTSVNSEINTERTNSEINTERTNSEINTETVETVEVNATKDWALICHRPPGNPNNQKTLKVGAPAVQAHLNHGDHLGECKKTERGGKKDKSKALICHRPPGNPNNQKTLSVGASAVQAHLNHGDHKGACKGSRGGKKSKAHSDKKSKGNGGGKTKSHGGSKKSKGNGGGKGKGKGKNK